MTKAILFDLDGTIGDTLPLCLAAFRKSIEPLANKHVSDREILDTFGPSEEATIKSLVPDDKFDQGLHGYWHWYEKLHDMCPEPFPGIREILEEIRNKGVFLGLVTGKAKTSADMSLRRFGLESFFQDSEYGWPLGPRKFDAITALLKRNSLPAAESVYVGDAPSDITASHEAGVKIAAAAWAGTAEPDRLENLKPDWLLKSIDEFSVLVHKLLAGEEK